MIILAVSGGRDSMAMLVWFEENWDKAKFMVVNVEHGIRGDESVEDSNFVLDYCRQKRIVCVMKRVDAPNFARNNHYSMEQGARILRRQIYEEMRLNHHGSVVATAHHLSDQTETMLMNIFRGSGLRGISGTHFLAEGGIIHPLATTSKAEIDSYILQKKIPFREDSTNNNVEYTRNFIRQIVLPTVKDRFPTVDNAMNKLASQACDAMDYISSVLPPIVADRGGIIIDFDNCHKVIIAEQIRRACRHCGVYSDIEQRHIELLCEMCDRRRNSARLQLPYGLTGYIEYGKLVIARDSTKDNAEIKMIRLSESVNVGGYAVSVVTVDGVDVQDTADTKGEYNSNLLPINSVLRTRRQGDFMQLSGGKKSLGDIMTDKKIPIRLRDNIPVVAKGNEVLVLGDILAGAGVRNGISNAKLRLRMPN